MGRLRAANKQDPFDPTLFGARLFGQFVIIDVGGALFGIASMSDGIYMTIGL